MNEKKNPSRSISNKATEMVIEVSLSEKSIARGGLIMRVLPTFQNPAIFYFILMEINVKSINELLFK